MRKYPEHEKLQEIADQSQTIGEFLECNGYVLCQYEEEIDEFVPHRNSIEQILAEYFGIDLKKIDQEKRQMLEEMRKGS